MVIRFLPPAGRACMVTVGCLLASEQLFRSHSTTAVGGCSEDLLKSLRKKCQKGCDRRVARSLPVMTASVCRVGAAVSGMSSLRRRGTAFKAARAFMGTNRTERLER